jgi:nucleotide-binding universal stress UspA family protein
MMPRFRRVLVTTDFSAAGDKAIPYAYAILGRGPGTVILGHVLELLPVPDALYAYDTPPRAMPRAERAALARQHEQRLARLVQKRVPRGVTTELRVVDTTRPVYEAICKLARSVRADVIVIGSHGRSGIARMLLGSTTDRVLRLAHRPVLVVRP